jgi:plastocyanin
MGAAVRGRARERVDGLRKRAEENSPPDGGDNKKFRNPAAARVSAWTRPKAAPGRIHRRTAAAARSIPSFAFALLAGVLPLHADITGTVTLIGKPNSQDETFVAKARGCGESAVRRTENWRVGPKGELGDVVVWIVDPKLGNTPVNGQAPIATVTQVGCRYVPHVAAVRAGEPLIIVNGDPTLHNVRAKVYDGPGQPPGEDVFNFGQPLQGQKDKRTFDTPGIYTLQCDVHAWMQCWVRVLPKAELPFYALTDKDGLFTLIAGEHLADGDYKLDAWHPRFADPIEQVIHVKNGTATVNLQFDAAKSF